MEVENSEKLLDKLDEIILLLKFISRDSLKEVVQTTLRDKKDFLIYDLTDGKNSSTIISNKANCSQPTVVNVWNRWKKAGIAVEVSNVQGRCKVLCSLEELGLK